MVSLLGAGLISASAYGSVSKRIVMGLVGNIAWPGKRPIIGMDQYDVLMTLLDMYINA